MTDFLDRLAALADRYAIERAGKPVCTTIIGACSPTTKY